MLDRSTNQLLQPENYHILYGWEFVDAVGASIDSSLFANRILRDSFGNLRLYNLAGPRNQKLPLKIRCLAIVSEIQPPSVSDQLLKRPNLYYSDYFGLDIERSDGSRTTDNLEIRWGTDKFDSNQ